MARIGALAGRSFKGIDILKVRRRSLESLAINPQMPIVADPHPLVAQRHPALNIKLVLRQNAYDPFGLENNDLASFGLPKVARHAIHEKMVARDDPQLDQVLAALELPWKPPSHGISQPSPHHHIFGWK